MIRKAVGGPRGRPPDSIAAAATEHTTSFILMGFPFEDHQGRYNYIASAGLLHARFEGQPRRIGA